MPRPSLLLSGRVNTIVGRARDGLPSKSIATPKISSATEGFAASQMRREMGIATSEGHLSFWICACESTIAHWSLRRAARISVAGAKQIGRSRTRALRTTFPRPQSRPQRSSIAARQLAQMVEMAVVLAAPTHTSTPTPSSGLALFVNKRLMGLWAGAFSTVLARDNLLT